MLGLTDRRRIYLVTGTTDLRKSFTGLFSASRTPNLHEAPEPGPHYLAILSTTAIPVMEQDILLGNETARCEALDRPYCLAGLIKADLTFRRFKALALYDERKRRFILQTK